VSIATKYDDSRPRQVIAVTFTCQTCGQTWAATPSRGGHYSDTGLTAQSRAHRCAVDPHAAAMVDGVDQDDVVDQIVDSYPPRHERP
jgi:hypothetical protein